MTSCWKDFFNVQSIDEIVLTDFEAILTNVFPEGILYQHTVPGIRINDVFFFDFSKNWRQMAMMPTQ